MNGGFPRAYFSLPPAPAAGYPGAGWGRLGAALAASCLLHAAIFVLPYFGASATAPRPAASPQKAEPLRVVELARARPESAPPPPANRARGTDHLPLPAPAYYRSDELTRPPRPTSQPRLEIPRSVARAVTGNVVLRLWISELGNVDSVEIEDSNLPETVSGMVAAAFGKLRFSAGELDGRRVRTLMRIEVAYVRGKPPP